MSRQLNRTVNCNGQSVLLLPGMMCDARLWRHQAVALADAGHTLCYGDLTHSDSIESIAVDVLAAAPQRFCMAGLSMGGIVALEIWRQAPDRVVRLALLDTNARPEQPERCRSREQQLGRLKSRGLDRIMREEVLPQYFHACKPDHDDIDDLVLAMAESLGSGVFDRQSRALMNRRDSRPLLTQINCPTLVLCGAEDALCPVAYHQEMAEALPDSVLEVIPACGHLSTLEQPAGVLAALQRWLGRPVC